MGSHDRKGTKNPATEPDAAPGRRPSLVEKGPPPPPPRWRVGVWVGFGGWVGRGLVGVGVQDGG